MDCGITNYHRYLYNFEGCTSQEGWSTKEGASEGGASKAERCVKQTKFNNDHSKWRYKVYQMVAIEHI
jgi:hypothetical protein